MAVGSNGQTAGFLPDLSEKRPRGDWGLVLRNSARSIPASAKTGLILVQTSAAGFRKNGGHAQAGTCTETASWLLLAIQLAAVAFAAACAAVSADFAAAFAAFVFAAFAYLHNYFTYLFCLNYLLYLLYLLTCLLYSLTD